MKIESLIYNNLNSTTGNVDNTTSFLLGCNYWASHAGTAMWSNWRRDVVENDFILMKRSGMNTLRVFSVVAGIPTTAHTLCVRWPTPGIPIRRTPASARRMGGDPEFQKQPCIRLPLWPT
jgi:hypothetical protein